MIPNAAGRREAFTRSSSSRRARKNGPILLSRSPYDAKDTTARTTSQSVDEVLPAMYKEFVDDGYVIVIEDIRGIHNS